MDRGRKQSGASTIVIVLIAAFFILLPLGLLGWELLRFSIAQQQLRSDCDAAALAGGAMLANYNPEVDGNPPNEQWHRSKQAMQAAVFIFGQNSVFSLPFKDPVTLGAGMGNVTPVYNPIPSNSFPTPNPAEDKVTLKLTLWKKDGSQSNWTNAEGPTDQASRLIVDAYLGYVPPMLKAMGFGKVTVYANSSAGLPPLDIVLCFDLSGSMDDNTHVYLVRKWWNPSLRVTAATHSYTSAYNANFRDTTKYPGAIQYDIVAYDTIYNLFCRDTPADKSSPPPLYQGVSINALPPQNLDLCTYSRHMNPTLHKYTFRPEIREFTGAPAGSLTPEQGRPPGNTPPSTLDPFSLKTVTYDDGSGPVTVNRSVYDNFTDLVVIPDGGTPYWSMVPLYLEIARGNMDTEANLAGAMNVWNNSRQTSIGGYYVPIFYTYPGQSTPQPQYCYTPSLFGGWLTRDWYQTTIGTPEYSVLQPISDSILATKQFFDTMHDSADCHFGLVVFSDGIGSGADDNWGHWPSGSTLDNTTNYNIAGLKGYSLSTAYPDGGTGTFPLPLVDLKGTDDNYALIKNKLTFLRATGKTNIADALRRALESLNDQPARARNIANKSIVLFSDGVPNLPTGENPATNPVSVPNIDSDGVVGLAKKCGIKIHCIGLATNTDIKAKQSEVLEGHIAKPTEGSYIQVSDASQLTKAFQALAKSMVVLK